MATKHGTPLTDVADFPAAAAARLADLWLTTAEEFASAAYQQNGIASLASYLSLSTEQIGALLAGIEALLPEGVAFDDEDVPVALGALPVDDVADPADEPLAFDALPETVDLRDRMSPPRNQGTRSTCVAHATAAVREYLLNGQGDAADLSEQFLYWACKARDGYAGPGTWIRTGMEVLQELGVCPEAVWPYNSNVVVGAEGQGPPPDAAAVAAAPQRIVEFEQLHATWVSDMRKALAAGRPVAFSVDIFASSQRPFTIRGGDLRLPLPGEKDLGGHAMCMVGYVDDLDVPGDGYFIVRNSWGAAFGYDGEVAPGYCRLPYAYVAQHGIEAYAVTAV